MTPAELEQQKAQDRQARADGDLRELLKLPAGRRFLFGLLDGACGAMAVSFRHGQPDVTAYLEGRRSVGVELVVECQRVAPADYVQMLSEAFKTREADRLVAEAKSKEQSNAG